MSVTISIANDTDKSIVEEYECMYCQGDTNEQCGHCKGTGKVVFKSSQWKINLSNGNFCTLWSALGLKQDSGWCMGDIDSRQVLRALDSLNPQLVVRATHVEGNVINCGIDEEYVTRRIAQLRAICDEAAKREELVVWG